MLIPTEFEHPTEKMGLNPEIVKFFLRFSPLVSQYEDKALEIAWRGLEQPGGWQGKIDAKILEKDKGTDEFWLETDWFGGVIREDCDPDVSYYTVWKSLYRFRMVFYTHFSVDHAAPDEQECEICRRENELNMFRDTMVEKRKLERVVKKVPQEAEVYVQESKGDCVASDSKLDIRGRASKLQANLYSNQDVADTAASEKQVSMNGSLYQTSGHKIVDIGYEIRYGFAKYWAEEPCRSKHILNHDRYYFPERYKDEPEDGSLLYWNWYVVMDTIEKSINPDGSPEGGLPEMSASGNDHNDEEPAESMTNTTDRAEDVQVVVESAEAPSKDKLSKIASKGKQKLLEMVKRKSGKDKKAKSSENSTESVKSVSASLEEPVKHGKKNVLRSLSRKAKDVLLDRKAENSEKELRRSSDTAAKTDSGLFSSIVFKRNNGVERTQASDESVSSTAGSEVPLLENAAKHKPEFASKKKCQKARNWIEDKSRKVKSGLIHREYHESHTAFVLRVVFALLKIMLKHTLKPVALLVTAAVLKFFAVLSGLD